ncbi:phosphoethanolamine transferase [Acidaminococcus fermentans]|uniref:phosphoethanolamine transferase n=1 Tax=Acidaminococcus fermentans TaxID=905 RepID=UPI003A8DE675
MYAFDALKKNIRKNQQQISLDKEKALPMKLPGTVILVVGETACRDYMAAFNPEYPLETTPWESSIRRTDGFFFFPQAYSNFSNTVMALSQSLTSSNQYNNMPLGESVDLVSLAKKAGYHTYWFSTQGKGEVWDAAITTLASQADTRKWMPWKHDGQLLELLKMVPADQNNFIVLHLNGSHYRYRDRVPKKFAQDHTFSQVPKEEGEFDTSLAYTDEVLQQVYQYSHKHLNLQVMVYFSDHGENMKCEC